MKSILKSALLEMNELPYRVLLVEDDADLRILFERILCRDHPCVEIEWASSAEDAMSILEKRCDATKGRPFDLIIADILLQGSVNGLDFWRLCKMTFPEIPVVVTSAMSIENFFQALGKGTVAPAFLPKPFSPESFRHVIEGISSPGVDW